MKVDIEDIIKYMNWKHGINFTELDKIEWYYDGKPISVTCEEIEDWRFTGLSNVDFAVMCLLDHINEGADTE